jgi:hypothetical protein
MREIRLCCAALILSACALAAETPSITGVWKANLDASTFQEPKPTSYLMIIQQQGSVVRETIGTSGMFGDYRAAFTFGTGSQESRNSWRGLPMRSKAAWQNGAFVVDSRVAGQRVQTIHDTYSLSADGNTLTIHSTANRDGQENTETIVLTRQPNDAGEALRQPEIAAGKRFKNVMALGDLPASRFLDTMVGFNMSLGVECEFCHVQKDFSADDKKEKVAARQMIDMTHGINEQSFNGRSEIRCYTCHRGAEKPRSAPE